MSWNWTGEPIPERPQDWSLFDILLILGLGIVVTVIGVVAAGGPN